jgi:hypothetical protein
LVELFGRYGFDKLAMGLKLSRQIPRRAPPTTSQVTKRGIADLALHNLLAIPHRKLECHQIGIIPNGLASRQRHEPGSFPMAQWKLTARRAPPAERLVLLPTVTDPALFGPAGPLKNFVDDAAVDLDHAGNAMFDVRPVSEPYVGPTVEDCLGPAEVEVGRVRRAWLGAERGR